jgi:protoheme IX farnesyltransferase
VTLVPALIGMAGWIYFTGAFLLGLGLLWFSMRMWTMKLTPIVPHSKLRARQLLQATVIYLPLLFALMVIDRLTN